jgi:hypothetical protein
MRSFIDGLGKPKPKADATPGVPAGDVPPTTPEPQPADVTDEVWEKAPFKFKNAYYKYRRETEGKLTATEAKLKELEAKPNQSAADVKRIKELEERATKLEKDLEARENVLMQADYSKSREFKEKYADPGERAYAHALTEVKQLMVKATDGEGNEIERPATDKDFNALRQLPIYERDKKVNEMFGFSANRVILHMNKLEQIEMEANEAIGNARTKSEENRRTAEKQHTERSAEYNAHAERVNAELLKTHAVYFAPDPANPEASAALERGLKYVDEAAANNGKMSPKDLAETTAMIRFLAGSAPRLMTEVKQLREQLAARDEELGKYRKSSPGGAPPIPSGGTPPIPDSEKRGAAAVQDMLEKAVGKR